MMGLDWDIRDILERSDMYAREKKNQHAFCMDVDRKGDVRVLCNLESNVRWAEDDPPRVRPWCFMTSTTILSFLIFCANRPHTLSTEAIAMLMGPAGSGWGVADETWRESSRQTVGRLAPELRDQGRPGHVDIRPLDAGYVPLRAAAIPGSKTGLETLSGGDMVEKYQLLHRPEGRDEPDWAAKIHLALHPVYYQNYILGELSASQLKRHLAANFGGLVDNPRGRPVPDRASLPGRAPFASGIAPWSTPPARS